jgi:hypothetical protein
MIEIVGFVTMGVLGAGVERIGGEGVFIVPNTLGVENETVGSWILGVWFALEVLPIVTLMDDDPAIGFGSPSCGCGCGCKVKSYFFS